MKKITGIGSIPFTDKLKAIQFSLSHHLPFVPELVALGENIGKSEFSLEDSLIKLTIERSLPLKTQIVGPNTFLSIHSNLNENDYLIYLNKRLNKLAGFKHPKLFLQIDEPILSKNFNSLEKVMNKIIFYKMSPIIHTCSQVAFDFFPIKDRPYLAIDCDINKLFQNDQRVFIHGFDPRKTKLKSSSEFISFTCGFGTLSELETEKITKNLFLES